jgi:hypothetical protein
MLTRELKLRLEQACRRSGRSLAEEACYRLALSFEAELLEQIERHEGGGNTYQRRTALVTRSNSTSTRSGASRRKISRSSASSSPAPMAAGE